MTDTLNYQLGDRHPKFDEVMALCNLTNQTLRHNLKQIAPELTQALILVGEESSRDFVYGMLVHARAMVQSGVGGLWESDEMEIEAALSRAIAVLDKPLPTE